MKNIEDIKDIADVSELIDINDIKGQSEDTNIDSKPAVRNTQKLTRKILMRNLLKPIVKIFGSNR